MFPGSVTLLSGLIAFAAAQSTTQPPPSSSPHNYTGIPPGPYSPAWQKYFEVTERLTNVTWDLPRNYAGNVYVNRRGHRNDSLFFWGFENRPGSLTAPEGCDCHRPWMIWLNGGPGSSSMIGLTTENGPIRVNADYSITQNEYSWDRLADTFWIDQPVGTGFSTADSKGYIADEEDMARDFAEFLGDLVQVFPSLACRPLYLNGESYAGTYIPYIAKHLFSMPYPPVTIKQLTIGDGTMGDLAAYGMISVVEAMETYPMMIDFDDDVYQYFRTQQHLCGYDLNFTYPESAIFPTLRNPLDNAGGVADPSFRARRQKRIGRSLKSMLVDSSAAKMGDAALTKRDLEERAEKKLKWKRDLSGRANGTIDPWYGCDVLDELYDYVENFTFPWNHGGGIDVYYLPDALSPEVPSTPDLFLNDPGTRHALHAPLDRNWTFSINYPFNSTNNASAGSNQFGDPSPPPMVFLTELAANASAQGVRLAFYSGNEDGLVCHKGTQAAIQNMTFGGYQGFTRKPATPWYDDDGQFAGVIHQERNVTYALFIAAGHLVPARKPRAAYKFMRDFILGPDPTGRVEVSGEGQTTVVGGEQSDLAGDILAGTTVVFYGSGTTEFSSVAPSQAVASWYSMLQTATLTAATTTEPTTPPSSTLGVPTATSSA